nr:MAG TPA: hypothetical protein [Caudoviricetes sp.]
MNKLIASSACFNRSSKPVNSSKPSSIYSSLVK